MLQHSFPEANHPPHLSTARLSTQQLKLLQCNQWPQHMEAITPMLLLSSHRQTLLHLDMVMTTNPNPMAILEDSTRTTKDLEATTTTTKEAIKVSRATAKTKGMEETTSTNKVTPRLNHQPQCITTRVAPHTTVGTTHTTSHNHSSSSKSRITTTTTRTLEGTMLELRASSQLLLKGTMDKDRHSTSQSSNTTLVVITKTPLKDQEGTLTGKIQASNQT